MDFFTDPKWPSLHLTKKTQCKTDTLPLTSEKTNRETMIVEATQYLMSSISGEKCFDESERDALNSSKKDEDSS